MATTVAQHPVTAFTSPTNGTSPIDADEVVANDSAIRTAYNAHDADTGIHVQSSVFGSRPAAGTSGRKFITVDQLSAPTQIRSFYDDGTNWYEHNYFGSATTIAAALTVTTGGIAVTGNSTITGTLGGLTGLTVASGGASITGSIVAVTGVESDSLRMRTTGGLTVSNAVGTAMLTLDHSSGLFTSIFGMAVSAGGIAVTGNSTITGTLGGLTGLTVASGGAAIGGGATITGSAIVTADLTVDTDTLKVDSANNRVGVGTASPSTAFHVVGASTLAGTVTVSAGSTTNALTVTTTGAIQGSFRYDSSNRLDISVGSSGTVTFDAVGAAGGFIFNDNFNINNAAPSVALNVSGTVAATFSSSSTTVNNFKAEQTGGYFNFRTNGSNTDRVRIPTSAAAGDVWLMVYDETGATLSQVSRGAADSGGTGYRLLRIPN